MLTYGVVCMYGTDLFNRLIPATVTLVLRRTILSSFLSPTRRASPASVTWVLPRFRS